MAFMADRLRQARIEAGWDSARSAALAHGWSVSTYTAHENGQNQFKPDMAEKYAKAFKTTPEWLLLGRLTEEVPDLPGIDAQLKELPIGQARALTEKFNAMIEGVRVALKLK